MNNKYKNFSDKKIKNYVKKFMIDILKTAKIIIKYINYTKRKKLFDWQINKFKKLKFNLKGIKMTKNRKKKQFFDKILNNYYEL